MKKFIMFLCVLIMFLGIAGCPSSDDTAVSKSSFTSTSTPVTSSEAGPEGSPVPEPTTLILIGSGLVGLAAYGRKKFKK